METLVTIRRLPDTALARIAPLDAAGKRLALERFHVGRPPFSYEPTRRSTLDLLNASTGLFTEPRDTPWDLIKDQIAKATGSDDVARQANLGVAKPLYDW